LFYLSVTLQSQSARYQAGIRITVLILFILARLVEVKIKQSSSTGMAEEYETSIFAVDGKKKRKRRGPRLTGVSKQRRLANARERKRVQALNEEIEVLKSLLPLSPQDKKPTKTEVIWLAAAYIDELTQMLHTKPSPDEFNSGPFLDFDSLLGVDIDNFLQLDGKCTIDL